MPELLIDERVKSAVKEVSSRMHVIFIDGKFVGITKRLRKNRGARHGIIREYLRRGIIDEHKFSVAELERVRQVPSIDLVSIKADLSASKMQKEEKTIKSVLDFVISDNGYKTLISSFLSGRGKTKLAEYKQKFLALEKEYEKAVASFQSSYSKTPGFQDFQKLNYLFNEESKTVITILDLLMSKEEIPFDIYKNLNFIDKLNSMRFLKKDWDSYGSYKIKPNIIQSAINFIEVNNHYYKLLAFVAPLNNGGVHLAYKNDKTRVEINFSSPTKGSVKVIGDGASVQTESVNISKKFLEDNL